MQCDWDMSDKDSTHIPEKCGKDAVVIYQGPRDFQTIGICKVHEQRGFEIYGSVGIGWKRFTPEGFEVFRVMSE